MTIFQVIILSIIEGLTEFLPISSTGHLILAQKYLGIPSTEFSKSFDIIIQLSAILAVTWFYRKKLLNSKNLWKKIIFSFLPTGILGFTLYPFVKGFLLDSVLITTISLFLGGLILLIVDRLPKLNHGKNSIKDLSFRELLTIGLFQSISMVPGVSRSAASIVGGLFSGLSRVNAVEFSFFLAIPTMLAASGYDLLKSGLHFTPSEYVLLGIGCLVTFISALISIKTFIRFVAQHNFTSFAIYRIILALTVWISFNL
jgi:undecaprenyl-diphosphatase